MSQAEMRMMWWHGKYQHHCLGCGKPLKDLSQYQNHARKCKRLVAIIQLGYSVPVITSMDLAHLSVQRLPDNKGWAIWNDNATDYVKDKSGHIDGRAFKRDADELLNCIIATSLINEAQLHTKKTGD